MEEMGLEEQLASVGSETGLGDGILGGETVTSGSWITHYGCSGAEYC